MQLFHSHPLKPLSIVICQVGDQLRLGQSEFTSLFKYFIEPKSFAVVSIYSKTPGKGSMHAWVP